MDFIISLTNKNAHVIKDKNNTSMEGKVEVQEHIYHKNLFIYHLLKKQVNSQSLEMIEDYLQRNLSKFQDQETTNPKLKQLK